MERAEFLARLRAVLPAASQPDIETADCRPDESGDLAAFTAELESVGGTVHHASCVDEARAILATLFAAGGIEKVVHGAGDTIASLGLESDLAGKGIELFSATDRKDEIRHLVFECDAGVTEAAFGIAETGSIVELASHLQPRCLSLVPPVHVAMLRTDRILSDLSDLSRLVDRFEEPLPSAITLITGPSRTGDIELVLTIGVHGPRSLHVVLLSDSALTSQPTPA